MIRMIANCEFRLHPLVTPGNLFIIDTAIFPLAEQNRWIAFVHSEDDFISVMKDPSTFLKAFQEMQKG